MLRILFAMLPAAALLAACGGSGQSGGSGGDLGLALDGQPHGRHAGIYLAVARGYDRALGVTLRVGKEPSHLRVVPRARLHPERDVAIMALQPGKLYLTTDRLTLDERRDDVRAAVEALVRGYEETIVDPESAVATMVEAEGLDRVRLEEELSRVAPSFKAGGRD